MKTKNFVKYLKTTKEIGFFKKSKDFAFMYNTYFRQYGISYELAFCGIFTALTAGVINEKECKFLVENIDQSEITYISPSAEKKIKQYAKVVEALIGENVSAELVMETLYKQGLITEEIFLLSLFEHDIVLSDIN